MEEKKIKELRGNETSILISQDLGVLVGGFPTQKESNKNTHRLILKKYHS
jgi:hypothetical protein